MRASNRQGPEALTAKSEETLTQCSQSGRKATTHKEHEVSWSPQISAYVYEAVTFLKGSPMPLNSSFPKYRDLVKKGKINSFLLVLTLPSLPEWILLKYGSWSSHWDLWVDLSKQSSSPLTDGHSGKGSPLDNGLFHSHLSDFGEIKSHATQNPGHELVVRPPCLRRQVCNGL